MTRTKKGQAAVAAPETQLEPATELETALEPALEPTEAPDEAPVEVAVEEPTALPETLYKCTGHADRFPEEEQFMLPLEAFPLTVDGKRRGVYCKRCQGKLHTEYGRRKRAEVRNNVERQEEAAE